MNRKRSRFLMKYLVLYVLFVVCLVVGLKINYKRKFSQDNVNILLNGVSGYRDKTDDLCKYAIKGDPSGVGKKYVKINFWCTGRDAARSTMSLVIFDKPTFFDVINEYARIINFDVSLLEKQKWVCKLNGKLLVNNSVAIPDASDIDCYDKKAN